MALDNWNYFQGWCLSQGIKPLKLNESEFQDLVYYWLCDGRDDKEMAQLERDLTIPPVGVKIKKNDPIWSRDAEMAAFKSATRQK